MTSELPTVVIADDSADVRGLMRLRLRMSRRFAVVAEAADGAEAVRRVAEHQPDLLLLDVSMPVSDGLEALPQVREVSPRTAVVLFSGFDGEGLAERAEALGAAAFIEKSVDSDELIERLAAIVDAPPATPDAEAEPPVAPPDNVLAEHIERFREVFEEAAIGMATVTLAGRIVRANRALGQLVGVPPEDLVGQPYASVAVDLDADAVAGTLREIEDGGADLVRLEHRLAGRRPRFALATFAAVRDTARRPLYLFAQVQDVTAQRQAEEALRQSEERFRLLVDVVQDYAIFLLDPTGHIASWNAGAQRIKGYTADEIIGQHFRVFYPQHKQDERHPEHELEIAMAEGHYAEEGWRIRKDGSLFWASVVITAVRNERGEHIGFTKVTRDMTERRRTEEALRQSEERFRLLVDVVQDYAIFLLDPSGHIASWNVGAQRINGWSAEEVIGQHFRLFYPKERQQERHPEHELEIALAQGHYEEEGWRLRKDGERFWANVLITAVRNDSGEHIGFTKVTRDMTERRRLQLEREQANTALAMANRELAQANTRLAQTAKDQSQFVAVTAHELRSPIGVLSGSAEMLSRHWADLEPDERSDMLASIGASGVRLRRLLGDLLTAARLESGRMELHLQPVDIPSLLGRAVSAARAAEPELDIEADSPPALAAWADPDRLAQILDNLVANALRHGKPPVRLRAAVTAGQVEIRVTDAGPGVAPEMRDRLFDRFATGESRSGTGLGLFIVRELARAMGGDAFHVDDARDTDGGAFVVTAPRLEGSVGAPPD